MGIERADIRADSVKVTFAEGQSAVAPEKAVRMIMKEDGKLRILPPASLQIMFDDRMPHSTNLGKAQGILMGLKE